MKFRLLEYATHDQWRVLSSGLSVPPLQQAKYFAWDLNYAGTFAVRNGTSMGLLPERSKPQHHSICLPIAISRAEALRQLNSRFGAP